MTEDQAERIAEALEAIAKTLDHLHGTLVREVHTEQFAALMKETIDDAASSISSEIASAVERLIPEE